MARSRRRVVLGATLLILLSACTKTSSPFEGIWNNSKSGTEGIWLFIAKMDDERMLVRMAVGRPDNFGPSCTARVMGTKLVLEGPDIVKELVFLDESKDTLITVNDVVSEIQFFRQK